MSIEGEAESGAVIQFEAFGIWGDNAVSSLTPVFSSAPKHTISKVKQKMSVDDKDAGGDTITIR